MEAATLVVDAINLGAPLLSHSGIQLGLSVPILDKGCLDNFVPLHALAQIGIASSAPSLFHSRLLVLSKILAHANNVLIVAISEHVSALLSSQVAACLNFLIAMCGMARSSLLSSVSDSLQPSSSMSSREVLHLNSLSASISFLCMNMLLFSQRAARIKLMLSTTGCIQADSIPTMLDATNHSAFPVSRCPL